MKLIIEPINKKGMQIIYVKHPLGFSVVWVLDYAKNIKKWKHKFIREYKIKEIIIKKG